MTRVSDGNLAQLDQLYSPGYTRNHNGMKTKGYEEWKVMYKGTKSVYPDMKISLKDMWIKGDKATILWSATATNAGPLGEGMPATGKSVSIDGVSIATVKDGKITDEWAAHDRGSEFAQLGYTFQPPAAMSIPAAPKASK